MKKTEEKILIKDFFKKKTKFPEQYNAEYTSEDEIAELSESEICLVVFDDMLD